MRRPAELEPLPTFSPGLTGTARTSRHPTISRLKILLRDSQSVAVPVRASQQI
jgi:hypothetical protein